MPAYHSSFLEDADTRIVSTMALLPLNTKVKGPAYPPQDPGAPDILDECVELFRANTFFRNFTIDGPSDRTLIYGILYISECLTKLMTSGQKYGPQGAVPKQEAVKLLTTLALDQFSIPGEAGFPLNNIYAAPSNRNEADLLRSYLTQFRQELGARVIEKVYFRDATRPDKFWLAFTKRKFMGR
ncbi:actin-related protein 2/3 complex subunit 3 [Protomyces lactucae-debilis]|uniref:Actin-related protein 2/3 complex subunit 3 n=1 Tax=Protomyces lactucae-debilis TaxID=2754530 RepID=A0A1Y2FQB7_PROLT|nr:actin-related protein 2/3 complex subunit 3 [Protomyces lactucae-debilis]ORY86192.1 actin-related protein 2/3 complex subunit 3 [Protomyces lactucae-debilis]